MREYFTDIPICPNCFEPANIIHLEQLKINNNIFKCNCCGTYFKNHIKTSFGNKNVLFPLFSKINLNKIESSVVDWVYNEMDGKFIITWPWNTVKCLPIILSQFLSKNPKSKIVVFTNSDNFIIDEFKEHSIPNILNSLYFINNSEISFSDKNLSLNDIYMKYDFNNLPKIDKNINDSFFKCFEKKFDLISPFSDVKYCFIKSFEDINIGNEDSQIFFIDETILSYELTEFLKEISPDLVIATDIDKLKGNKFRNNPIFKIFALNCHQLLFSVNARVRSTHKIGQEDYFLKNWNIIPHTWDYRLILDKIEELDENESSFCSSKFSEIVNLKANLNINLVECPELSKIESIFGIFNEIFPYDNKVGKTLYDLMKTPLYVKGKYKDKRVLSRNITFEYLFSLIYNLDFDKWEILMEVFDDVYDFHGVGKNPISDSLCDLIKNQNVSYNQIAVIVHKYDIKGTKLIIDDKLGENDILVTSWPELNEKIENSEIKYGISTLFPPLSYNLFSSPLDNLEIICSPNNFVRFEAYKLNRLTENGLRPVHLLKNEDNAPELLKKCLEGIEIPQDYYDMLNKIHGLEVYHTKSRYHRFNYPKFRKNESAILILNKYNQGIFLKRNNVIFILEKDKMIDFDFEEEDYKDLVGKTLLINNQEYQSIGRLFFKFVIENGSDILLYDNEFKWIGFKDLIENMFEWVELLNKIIKDKVNVDSNQFKSIKYDIATELSKLNLNASREEYINNFWLQEPQPLETEFGNINIYDSERPHGRQDIPKIYKWVSENYPKFALPNLAARKSYAASRLLKRIRRNFLDTEYTTFCDDVDELNKKFRDFIFKERDYYDNFDIIKVEKVKTQNDVRPYEIINNPYEYVKKVID